mmetsp:Transcript_10561/g.20333  ORF Transcript_10561/g.20333 Transcript_10561/m.20333 type:complete len:243 (+) Transcript_10561:120-848(+)
MLAVPNRSIYKKLTEQEHLTHQRRLKNMRPYMRISNPQDFQHLRKKPVDHGRLTQIENDNVKIMTRIQELMKSKSDAGLSTFRHTSLNRDYRRKEEERISKENLELLKRLSRTSSVYPVKRFINERKENERYIKTRCQYPYSPVLKTTDAELIHSESRQLGEDTYLFEIFRRSTYIHVKAKHSVTGVSYKAILTDAEVLDLGDNIVRLLDFVTTDGEDLSLIFPKGLNPRRFVSSKSPVKLQ